jgi:molybdopterin synthase catalytic subunit
MAHPVCEVSLTESPLTLPPEWRGNETGAVVDFWGIVRATENGAEIRGIEYEAHAAMAEHQLGSVAREAAARFGLSSISICHRIGFVGVGEASLLVRIGTGHRAEGFAAAKWAVDELKKRVPIWKHPRLQSQGTAANEPILQAPAALSPTQ